MSTSNTEKLVADENLKPELGFGNKLAFDSGNKELIVYPRLRL